MSRRRRWNHATLLLLTGATLWSASGSGCQSARRIASHRAKECQELCQKAEKAQKSGQTDQAWRLLDEAIQKNPHDVDTRWRMAELMLETDRPAQAVVYLRELMIELPDDPRPAVQLAEVFLEKGQLPEAADAAAEALSRAPTSIDALMVRGRIQEAQHNWDDALQTYRSITEHSPDYVAALLGAARVQRAKGCPDMAASILRRVLQVPHLTTPERGDAEWQLGLAYASQGRRDDAIQVLASSLDRKSATAEELGILAELRFSAGQIDQAKADAQKALRLDPLEHRALAIASGRETGVIPASGTRETPTQTAETDAPTRG